MTLFFGDEKMLINPLSTNIVTKSLSKSLDIAALKQKITASNLANIDTPGYKAKTMDFRSALKNAVKNATYSSMGLDMTDNNHLEISNEGLSLSIEEDNETIPKNDGNNVDLDKEMMEMSETNAVFKVSTRFLIDKIRMIKYTLREGR